MDLNFYQRHLDDVSRSFAYCIKRLDSPLRDWVSLMYLVCRILDTGEDVPWESIDKREIYFSKIREALQGAKNSFQVPINDSQFLSEVDSHEKKLIDESEILFHDFHKLDAEIKEIVLDLVLSMSHGMEYFLNKQNGEGTLRISNEFELNQYCFYVAGVVGEALTRLLAKINKVEVREQSLKQSYHFGLFLQKINILKDQIKDKKQGRDFIVNRQAVRASLRVHAEQCMAYIQSLDDKNLDFKVFCAWSFFLGLASLPYIDKSYEKGKDFKIPRLKTMSLLQQVEKRCLSNKSLVELYNSYKEQYLMEEQNPQYSHCDDNGQWLKAYMGLLPEKEIQGLVRC